MIFFSAWLRLQDKTSSASKKTFFYSMRWHQTTCHTWTIHVIFTIFSLISQSIANDLYRVGFHFFVCLTSSSTTVQVLWQRQSSKNSVAAIAFLLPSAPTHPHLSFSKPYLPRSCFRGSPPYGLHCRLMGMRGIIQSFFFIFRSFVWVETDQL